MDAGQQILDRIVAGALDSWGEAKFHHFERQASIQRSKDMLAEQCRLKSEAIVDAIARLLKPEATPDEVAAVIKPIMEAESKVYTAKNEALARRQDAKRLGYPPMKVHPRKLGPRADGTIAYAYDVNLEDLVERDLHYDSHFYDDILRSNERWQARNRDQTPPAERRISDVNEGSEWSKHEQLGALDYGGIATIATQGYADGVDVPNPLGTAAGHHHMTFVYVAPLNRDPATRNQLAAIWLACVVLTKDLKEFTPALVISGEVGEPEDSTSLGAGLRRFDKGVNLKVPGHGVLPFRGWLFSFVGDAPAVAEIVGTKSSFSKALNICNLCEDAHKPAVLGSCKFLGCVCPDDRNHNAGCESKFALRTATRDAELQARTRRVSSWITAINFRFAVRPPGKRPRETEDAELHSRAEGKRPLTPLELGLAKARSDCVHGDGAAVTSTSPQSVTVVNDGVVFLHGVRDPRFRNTYARIVGPALGADGRVPVRVLPTPVAQVAPQSAGESIRVRPQSYAPVPCMKYYTYKHPTVAAWVATYATPEMVASQVVPEGFANSQAVVAIAVPQGTLLSRFYYDCQPPPETPGFVTLMHMNAGDYEAGAKMGPVSGATATSFDECIAEFDLPPPEIYLVRG